MSKTKKSLILSAVAIILTLVLMIGTTFALFSSSVTSEDNTVRSAGYEVSIQYCDTFGGTYTDLTTTAIFNDTLTPGISSAVKYIKVTNSNSYPVTVNLSISAKNVTAPNAKLYLGYNTVTAAETYDNLTKVDFDNINVPLAILNGVNVAANSSVVVAMATGLDADATIPNVTGTFSIAVVATQATS